MKGMLNYFIDNNSAMKILPKFVTSLLNGENPLH